VQMDHIDIGDGFDDLGPHPWIKAQRHYRAVRLY